MRSIVATALAKLLFLSTLAAQAAAPPPPVAGYTAQTFNFTCIAGCEFVPPIGDQLFMQVIHDADPVSDDPNIYFKFWNLAGTSTSVVQVSIDSMSAVSLLGGSGTTFVAAGNANLPGGNNAVPPFVADVSFTAIPGAGINTLTDNLELMTSSATFEQVIEGIQSSDIRFGLYVTDFPGLEVAAAYVNAIPEPDTYSLLLAGLGLAVGMAGRRRLIAAVGYRPSAVGLSTTHAAFISVSQLFLAGSTRPAKGRSTSYSCGRSSVTASSFSRRR